LGYTDFSVIETLQHLLGGFAPFAGGEITEALLGRSTQWHAREETTDEVVVTGREKALERKPGRGLPCHDRKVAASTRTRWNPKSAGRMK
jgi:hypothetical protein